MFAGIPTVFLPQPRIADDQDGRARAAAEAGAARIAGSVEDVACLLESPGDPAIARSLVPQNGARAAAAQVLQGVLPASDIAYAHEVLSPELWARALRSSGTAAVDVVASVAGATPSAQAERDALLGELADEGAVLATPPRRPRPATVRVARFLAMVEDTRAPGETAVAIVRGLRRKFPAAPLDAVVEACDVLFAAWARFGDWMGALSLVQALPVQRTVTIGDAATALADWLAGQDDLFDALRTFAQLEGHGARSLGEVLRALHHVAPGVPPAAELDA
jgi:hypothetical protein